LNTIEVSTFRGIEKQSKHVISRKPPTHQPIKIPKWTIGIPYARPAYIYPTTVLGPIVRQKELYSPKKTWDETKQTPLNPPKQPV